MADNPYVNRVETGDGETIMDITDTTATPGDVVTGQVFYASSGARSVGSLASKEAEQGGTDLSLVTTGEKYDWNSKANQSDLNDKADKTDTVLNTTLSRGRKANSTVGTGSLAFGNDVVATGQYSHAEGSGTAATASRSHSEGSGTTASGDSSHAEGGGTTASGSWSHAEGGSTVASGQSAHAEGGSSRATENCAHAEGGGTTASAQYAHAEGGGTTASGAQSHSEGAGTTASGANSHAEGASTRASGIESHAEGLGGTYTRNNSTYTSESAGVADHTEGYMCRTASGANIMPGNHAEGYQTSATGGSSHSEGSSTTASGANAHAEGTSTTASGADSHAEGAGSQATTYQAHAEGAGTIAAGQASHAEGASTNASGYCSHAEGYYTVANGTHAHAEGNNTTASGEDAHAEGSATTASGKWSHAEGSGTTASGSWSHAEGGGTVASGSNSHAEGENSVANHKNQHVFGSWNIADPSSAQSNDRGNYVEIVGNGTSSIAKSNARTLDWNGNEYLQGDLYVGCNADSSGGTKIEPVNNTTVLSALGTSSSGTRFLREDGTWHDVQGGGSDIDDTAGAGDTDKTWSADKLVSEFGEKANIVSGATSGNFAGIDANGNLTDSGSKPSDFLTSHQDITGKADKVSNATSGNFASLDSNGNLVDSGNKASDFITSHQDISGKADKVAGATSGNFASLDSNGNLTDSGKNASDFTVSVMTGASSSSAGASGLVPQPIVGDQIKFLCGDGTWKISPYMMYGAHYVEGDSNDTAGTWTGTLENLTAYYNGLTVIYVPKVAGASTTTLNLNDIGAITCYTTNTTKLDTQYTPNTPILFTYYDGYWRRADNDVNTTTISNLYHHYGNYVADSAIYRYQILFEKSEDKLTPITSANNDTGTSKTMLTNVEFNAFGRIFYYVSATTVEANGSVSAGSLCFAHESFNARYTLNCGTTLTAHKNLYLVVTPTTGNMCKIASSSPWAQELPSANDGNWYILLGRTYSTYQAALYPNHPVYMYDGTKVVQVMPNGFTASTMKGAGSSADGASGLVPKPVAGDQTKFLRGDGTWHTVSGGGGGATIDDTAGAGDTDKAWSADKLTTEFGGKADTVASATSGNFAGLDSNGNLVDSGSKASDFLTSHQDISGKADKADTVLTTTLSRGRKENTTVGTRSFAFGDNVTASATNSTAIGSATTASGFCSVAEGDNTIASGYYSHAQGSHTIAQRSSQFVFGEFNVADTEGNSGSYSGKYIEIVGNGESTGRSNARALDWDGNEYLKGDLYVRCDFDSLNGIKVDPRGTKSLTVQLDTVTNTSGSYSHTTSNELVTENMKPVQIECSDSAVFRGDITITTGNGTVTLACSNVVGTSSVSVVLMKEVDNTDPPTVTSSEFDILANRIGTLSSLETTEKTNVVGAINEVNTNVLDINNTITKSRAPTSSTTHTLNAPTGSAHFLIVRSVGLSRCWVGMVYVGSNAVVATQDIYKGNNITVTTDTNAIIFTLDSAQSFNFTSITLNGNNLSYNNSNSN